MVDKVNEYWLLENWWESIESSSSSEDIVSQSLDTSGQIGDILIEYDNGDESVLGNDNFVDWKNQYANKNVDFFLGDEKYMKELWEHADDDFIVDLIKRSNQDWSDMSDITQFLSLIKDDNEIVKLLSFNYDPRDKEYYYNILSYLDGKGAEMLIRKIINKDENLELRLEIQSEDDYGTDFLELRRRLRRYVSVSEKMWYSLWSLLFKK